MAKKTSEAYVLNKKGAADQELGARNEECGT